MALGVAVNGFLVLLCLVSFVLVYFITLFTWVALILASVTREGGGGGGGGEGGAIICCYLVIMHKLFVSLMSHYVIHFLDPKSRDLFLLEPRAWFTTL